MLFRAVCQKCSTVWTSNHDERKPHRNKPILKYASLKLLLLAWNPSVHSTRQKGWKNENKRHHLTSFSLKLLTR